MRRGGAESEPGTGPVIAGIRPGVHQFASPGQQEVVPPISPRELLQVGERITSERLPLLVIKQSPRNERIARLWRLPGTSVRVSPEGDIFYPVWRERESLSKPELYVPCAKLPRGWTFSRLLSSARRPISELVFHQVKKDGGGVEVAIRNMDHILSSYQEKGSQLEQVEAVQRQIDQAAKVLEESEGVSAEEFNEGFNALYEQTLQMMEAAGMTRAKSALKRDIDRLLCQASSGRDRLGRRNPQAMLKKLEAAARRVEYRRNEAGYVVDKFEAMRAGLVAQAANDRGVLTQAEHELHVGVAAHEAFRTGRTTQGQKGILSGKLGTLIYKLGRVRVKPYKPVASQLVVSLGQAQQMIMKGDYQGATKIFQQNLAKVIAVLG